MTKEEYINSFGERHGIDIQPMWSEPKFDCPECGGGGMCKNNMVVLTSIPPQYEYRCNKCGHVEYLEV